MKIARRLALSCGVFPHKGLAEASMVRYIHGLYPRGKSMANGYEKVTGEAPMSAAVLQAQNTFDVCG